jgi:tRNA U34 5-carboxymethylaminomethyl modifying GTPase MnmE/TrmE
MNSRERQALIKELCEEALKAEEREVEIVLQELRAALYECNEIIRKLSAEYLLDQSKPGSHSSPRKRNGH